MNADALILASELQSFTYSETLSNASYNVFITFIAFRLFAHRVGFNKRIVV